MNEVTTGNAREIIKGLPDGSIDLILTDPIYSNLDDYYWLYTECRRLLKPTGNVLAFVNAKWYAVVSRIVMSDLPPLACVQTSGASPMNGRIIAKTYYLLWFGSGKLKGYMPDGYIGTSWSAANKHNFKWTKNPKYLRTTLAAFTEPFDVVLDMFCGGGSVLAACKEMERNYIGVEMDQDTAEKARALLNSVNVLPLAAANTASSGLFDSIGTLPAVVNVQEGSEPA